MATGYKTIPNLDAASASQVEDDMLLEAAVIDLGSESGYASKRVTRGQLLAAMNDRVEVLEQGGKGVSNDLKAALLQIASKVAYIDEHGQDYYDDLYDALYPTIHATGIVLNKSGLSFSELGTSQQLTATLVPAWATDEIVWTTSDSEVATVSSTGLVTAVDYGTVTITATAGDVSATCSVVIAAATLVSISAVYSGGTVYDNISGLDDLKDDLVVTATWSDSTTTTLSDSDYTLSGSLNIGSNTITVTYGGQTDTFSVTVAEWLVSIAAVYTQSGTVYNTDSLNDLKTDLVVTATYDDTTTAVIAAADYTLSGTLTVGTSTITVTYGGKTATFTVTVTMSRESIFGAFVNGHALSKAVNPTTDVAINGIWVASTSARAAISTPILNKGYVITVTDSTKYNVAVYDVTDDTPIPTTYGNAIEHVYYSGGTKSIGWKTSDSATTPYILIAFKKMDNTAFTAAELANGAEEVFTYTESTP